MVFLAVVGLALTPFGGKPSALQIGSNLEWLDVGSEPTTIVLVLRAIDCLSCSVPNHTLRRVQSEGRSLIAVTPSPDEASVSQSLSVQRLPFTLQPVSGGRFEAAFGELALPALVVAQGGIVSSILPLESAGAGTLADRIEDLLAEVDVDSAVTAQITGGR